MPKSIFALLVGIDRYPAPVRSLRGCVNDIDAMESLLKERASDGSAAECLVLRNEEAKRQAIIDGFESHLGKAGSGDVALFYYCGHGSQQPTAPGFLHLEPDRLDETLVCYDSRQPGQYDLADKELSKLIAQVAQSGAHVLVILDSCHSGSGTRNLDTINVRRAPTDTRVRPTSSFLVTPDEASALLGGRSATGTRSAWLHLPRGRHVVLSACQSDEESKEMAMEGAVHGVFSYFLQQTLRRATATPTYRDLFKRIDSLVRTRVTSQCPLIEATDLTDLDRPFLGGAFVGSPPYFTVSFDPRDQWVIDAGALHGVPPPQGQETTWLAVFAGEAADLADFSAAIGEARVRRVFPGRAAVELILMNGQLADPGLTYKAVVTTLPIVPLSVVIEGDVDATAAVRDALATAGVGGGVSTFVRASSESPQLRVLAGSAGARIYRAADDRPLVVDVEGCDLASARQVVQRLEHIARWAKIAELANPLSSLAPEAVRIDLFAVGADHALVPLETAVSGGLRLEYGFSDGSWHEPRFKLRLTNTSHRRLYCMLLDLTQTYKVWPGLLPGGGIWLEPGQEAWALNGDTIYASIPEALWKQGLSEITDVLKLIVSTESADATLLMQDELDTHFVPRHAQTRASTVRLNTLGRLMHRVQTRDFGARPQSIERIADWAVSQVSITTVRPQAVRTL